MLALNAISLIKPIAQRQKTKAQYQNQRSTPSAS